MQRFPTRRLLLTPSAQLSTKTLRCLTITPPSKLCLVSRISALDPRPSRKLTTAVDYSGRRALRQYEPNWSEKTRIVYCCPDMYIPKPDGIQMNVVYVDTGCDLSSDEKTKVATVILVHGAGQTHKEMLPLAENLVLEGFRVVLPNFPGMGLTTSFDPFEDKMYGHTVEENMDFLGNFIHFLGIGKVDLIIGHSAACYALASLVTFLQNVDGYVYICPGTGPKPPKGVQPYWLFKMFAWMWEHPLLWPFVAVVVKLAIPLSRGAIPNNVKSATIALQSLVGARLYLTPKLAVMMRETQVPLLYCFTSRDPLVGEQQYKDYAELNGVSCYDVYDKELNLIEEGTRDFSERFCLGLKFDIATHQPTKSSGHREILVKHIAEMFHHNQQQFKNKLK